MRKDGCWRSYVYIVWKPRTVTKHVVEFKLSAGRPAFSTNPKSASGDANLQSRILPRYISPCTPYDVVLMHLIRIGASIQPAFHEEAGH